MMGQKVFVITAPSGTGKTTLNRKLIQSYPDIAIAVSHTTRQAREGERSGDHYWFTSEAEFLAKVKTQDMLEWAKVHHHYYGTSWEELTRLKDKLVILEIDVQGWASVKKLLNTAVGIFILPPSMEILWQRLRQRDTDSLEVCWRRFQAAQRELAQARHYQYFILNEDLSSACTELGALIKEGTPPRLDTSAGQAHCQALLQECEEKEWFRELREKFTNI